MQPTIIFKRRVPGLSKRELEEFVVSASRAARLRGIVTLLITGSREVRSLNSRFKGNNHPTDVLSFPPPTFVRGFAGDIVISLDVAARNARVLGHSAAAEVRILVLHAVLHLAGYDHESDAGEMARKELALRKRFSLPTSLIERNAQPTQHNRKKGARVHSARAST